MKRWTARRERLRLAEAWDEQGAKNEEVERLQRLFALAREQAAPSSEDWMWQRLKARIHQAEAPVPSFLTTLYSAGTRFALGGALAFALTLALYLSQAGTVPTALHTASGAADQGITAVASLASPADALGGALATQDAGDLLQFVAYAPVQDQ